MMIRENATWCRATLFVSAALLLSANQLHAAVLYSENFEGYTLDQAIPASTSNVGSGLYFVKPTSLVAANPPDGQQKMEVRSPSSAGLPDEGLTSSNANWSGSQFLEWHDAASAAGQSNIMAVGEFAPI